MKSKAKWITITGKVKEETYEYRKNEIKHKAKCKLCDSRMTYIKKRKPLTSLYDNIGYLCDGCNIIYIHNKYKVLLIEEV